MNSISTPLNIVRTYAYNLASCNSCGNILCAGSLPTTVGILLTYIAVLEAGKSCLQVLSNSGYHMHSYGLDGVKILSFIQDSKYKPKL